MTATATETATAIADIQKAWSEYKDVLERQDGEIAKIGQSTGETTQLLAKMDERLNELETKLSRPGAGGGDRDVERDERAKAFGQWLRKGNEAGPDVLKVLTRGDDTTGGVFASQEMVEGILKGETDITPFRNFVTVRQSSKSSIGITKRTGQFAATRIGESQARTETEGLKWGKERLEAHALHALVIISLEDLEDSEYDLEAEIESEAAEQLAVKEGAEWVSGTGANGQAEGILTNADVATKNNGHATELKYDGIMDFLHSFKPGYFNSPDFRMVFELATLGALRKVKDNNGNPLWTPMAADAPGTIAGKRYELCEDMPAIASNATPIAAGNFKRGYVWFDRLGMTVQRLVEKYAGDGQIGFQVRARSGGQVVLPEAIKKLKMAV